MDNIIIFKTMDHKLEYGAILIIGPHEKIVLSESDMRSISYKYQEIQKLRLRDEENRNRSNE